MTISRLLTLLAVVTLLHGCSSLDVDELDPMVPATADQGQPLDNPTSPETGPADDLLIIQPQDKSEVMTPTVTVAGHADLWQRVRNGFGIDLVENARIDAQRNWYAAHPAYFHRVMARSQRYLYYIVNEAEKRRMPLELALLPVVESAFDPFAYSHGHASGPWQFISSTGKYFNLTQDWWYDGRRDILSSTNAALTYLQKLADRFDGDWLLALASYNAGAGTVSKAIKRNKRAGLPTDFWHLNLPRETTAYVPKLIAVAQLIETPFLYNMTLPDIANKPYFSVVKTKGIMDLTHAANMADISVQELSLLNPGFNRGITPPNGPHRLLIPISHEVTFRDALANQANQTGNQWASYVVKSGDSLAAIGYQHDLPVRVLRQINQLSSNTIRVGQVLNVPFQPKGNTANNRYATVLHKALARHNQPTSGRQSTYTVKRGDSLWTIAHRHKVSTRDLMAWNKLSKRSVLRPGQRLKMYGLAPTTAVSSYQVKSGDSLWSIAHHHGVSVQQLASWNSLHKTSMLKPGQILRLSNAANTTALPAKSVSASGRDYQVEQGDSLWTIARQFDLTIDELLAVNKLSRKSVLQPGQRLSIPAKSGSQVASTKQTMRYSVRPGDSLYAIANRFNTSVAMIQQMNNINTDSYLQPGQSLMVSVGHDEIN